jgi:hypothetical protein
MLPKDHCLSKAEECELWAAEFSDDQLAAEWLRMAEEWRIAATLPQDGLSGLAAGNSD